MESSIKHRLSADLSGVLSSVVLAKEEAQATRPPQQRQSHCRCEGWRSEASAKAEASSIEYRVSSIEHQASSIEHRVSSPNGFTFVEVVIALAIVSISLLALIRLHLGSIRLAETARITSHAVLLAEEKIVEMLALGYPKEGANCGTAEEDTVRLHWQTEVTPLQLPQLEQAGVAGLREISVDVSWEQGIGRKHIRMFTYVADRKLQ